MAYNFSMANKGRAFEEEVIRANLYYKNTGEALVQKIGTPWNVVIRGKQIISAYPHMKTLSEVEKLLSMAGERFDICKKENEKFKDNKSAERLFIAGYNMRTYEILLDKKKTLISEAQNINYKINKDSGQIGFLL